MFERCAFLLYCIFLFFVSLSLVLLICPRFFLRLGCSKVIRKSLESSISFSISFLLETPKRVLPKDSH